MTRSACAAAAAVLATALLSARPASAQSSYDPRHEWRTLETPHFQLHFHEGEESLARRFAGAAEQAHARLVPILRHAPEERTQLVLSDDVDDANGSATVVPYDIVRLQAVPPESLSVLNDYRDWVQSLVTHEYVHILHMDTIGGIPRAANSIFGKVFVPNGVLPPWMIEGLAVLDESGPGAGRNSSALFDMYARAAVMEGPGLFRIDDVSNQPLDWPGGHLWYLLGGRFMAFLRERYGDGAIADFIQDQGDQVWPYLLNTLSRRHFGGKSLDRLWAEMEVGLRKRYQAQLAEVRGRPVTAPALLTRRGAFVQHPRWSPDGTVVAYFDQGLDERPGLRRVTADGRDLGRAAAVEGNGTLAMLGPGLALVAASDVHREYRIYDDLYLADLDTGERRRVTWGERATDPELWPGDGAAVYVARTGGGEHALRRVRLDGGPPETLFARPGAQIFSPAVSPDGRRIAFELQEGGRRDIVVLEDGSLRKVTDEDAIATGPCWSPDGRWLFFSSERTGIYDVYAWDGSGAIRQVTNVESGAFEPRISPDGKTLLFVTYSRAGYDLATIPLDPAAWLEPSAAVPRPADTGGGAPPVPDYPSHPYRATETLGPTFWFPVYAVDSAGTALGLVTGGGDVLGKHLWLADVYYSLSGRDVDYDVAYLGGWLHPQLTLASSRFVDTAPTPPGQRSQLESVWTPLEVGLAFPTSHLDRSHLITVGWRATLYRSKEAGPSLFRNGTAADLSLGAFYGDALRFTRSISPEEGRLIGLSLRIGDPAVGGDFHYGSARLVGIQYLRIPFTRHVVLGLRASLGLSAGTLGGRLPFELGGVPGTPLLDLLLGTGSPPDQLRGYAAGQFAGSALGNANVELRFPIAEPRRGISTWPVFLRRIHGAFFLDMGTVYVPRQGEGPGFTFRGFDAVRFGAGAELRLEVVLGYYLRTDVRIGLARGLGKLLASPRPGDPYALTQFYVAVGPSF